MDIRAGLVKTLQAFERTSASDYNKGRDAVSGSRFTGGDHDPMMLGSNKSGKTRVAKRGPGRMGKDSQPAPRKQKRAGMQSLPMS